MPDKSRDLILQLCAQAGMVMEDAVTNALTIGGLEDNEVEAVLDQLEGQSEKIMALIKAAKALHSRDS